MPADLSLVSCDCQPVQTDPVTAQLDPATDNGSRRAALRAREAAFVRQHWDGDGVVIDLMCGVGHYSQELDCRRYVGVDADPRMLRAAASRGVTDLIAADVRRLPFRSRRVADLVVWSYEGINAFAAAEAADIVARAVAMLRLGGYLFLDLGQFHGSPGGPSSAGCAIAPAPLTSVSVCQVCASKVTETLARSEGVTVRSLVQSLPGNGTIRSMRWYQPISAVTRLLASHGCEVIAAESLHSDCVDSDVPDTDRSVQIIARYAA
jgi:SAM-dependent methyltransferase